MTQIINPATPIVIAEPVDTPVEAIDDIVDRAPKAQREWVPLPQRHGIDALRRIADLVRANLEDIAQFETANVGKPIGDSRGEVGMTAGTLDKYFGRTIPVDGGMDFTVREPIGVVAVIASWNIAPALACGNAVIGDPMDSATAMDPLVSSAHLAKVSSFLGDALKITSPIAIPDSPGRWMGLHIVLDPPCDHRIVREEIFGPDRRRASLQHGEGGHHAGERHDLRIVRVGLDSRHWAGAARRARDGDGLGFRQLQHVSAPADAVWRLQTVRHGSRAGHGRDGRIHRTEEHRRFHEGLAE